jgi:hypothetical protein
MESKALNFFRALLIWNDVLSCSAQKKVPLATEVYRSLLTNDDFAVSFQNATGCENWVVVAIMDATILEAWKRDQEAQGNLSIRELVKRAGKLESTVEDGIKKLSKNINIPQQQQKEGQQQVGAGGGTGGGIGGVGGVTATSADLSSDHHHRLGDRPREVNQGMIQTYIFAHALLIHLHVIVSGSLAGVPEIQQSIERAIHAWELRPSSITPKSLSWPYCVSASLATGPQQRAVFRELVAELSPVDLSLGSLLDLKSVVEECWKEFDGRSSDRDASIDWRDIMRRSNLGILFT